jgi:hypothetical protein
MRSGSSVEVPLTVGFEGAYSTDPEEAGANVARLKPSARRSVTTFTSTHAPISL